MIPTFLILVVAIAMCLAAVDLFAATGAGEAGAWSLVTYGWIALWGALAGVVSFAQKVRAGTTRWLNLGELFGEVFISAFVGIITGLLCEAAKFPTPLTWALVGITGHAGGRGIFWLERLLQRVAEKNFGVSLPTAPDPQPGTPGDER
jgi:hypothetical protein